jgi:hypothetical protein
MTPETVLKLARQNIANPKRWLQRTTYIEGDCMCAVGAVMKAANPMATSSASLAIGQASVVHEVKKILDNTVRDVTHFRYDNIISYNDHLEVTHKDVLKIFDVAIEKVSKK